MASDFRETRKENERTQRNKDRLYSREQNALAA